MRQKLQKPEQTLIDIHSGKCHWKLGVVKLYMLFSKYQSCRRQMQKNGFVIKIVLKLF